MVGATKSFIRQPFLIKAVLLGIIGATIACLGLFGLLYYLDEHFSDLRFLSDVKLIGILLIGVYAVGMLITLISTFFATRHFLNLNSEQLHY